MLQTAIEAADLLAQEGVTAGVLAVHTLKPLDEEAVREHARASDALVTLEEHSIIGGLGGAVAEVLMETPGLAVRFKRLGLPSAFSSEAGTQEYLRGRFGLTAGSVAAQVRALLKPVAPP
jgi:transketolase